MPARPSPTCSKESASSAHAHRSSYPQLTSAVFNGERRTRAALGAAGVLRVHAIDGAGGALVPRDVLDVAIEAARNAGRELSGRFGHEPAGVATKRGPMDLVSDADRAAEQAVAAVLE